MRIDSGYFPTISTPKLLGLIARLGRVASKRVVCFIKSLLRMADRQIGCKIRDGYPNSRLTLAKWWFIQSVRLAYSGELRID